jgi:phospholipid/cholesterol/gamma-HCH transport system substrate-binding protein
MSMRWKKADVLAGLFVIAGAALILAIIITVRGQFSAPDRYHTFFKNVAGLRAGAAVVYEGYIIGEVVTIAPVPDDSGMRFRIDIGIEAGWVIPSDSLAEISAVSLLSANVVQIMAGSAEPLRPGDEINSVKTANVMAEISRTADQLTGIAETNLVPLLETIRDVLEGEGRDALASVSVLGEALADETPRIMSNLESATANMATITGGDNAASITRTISNVERASEGAIQAVDEVAVVAETVGRVASDANLGRVDSILTRMDAAAIELEALLATASDTLQRTDAVVSDENLRLVTTILQDMQTLQTGVGEIIEASHATSQNALQITTLGEDRIEGFLQRMESAALNVEEMTARLRDDPSLLIRGRD